MRFVENQLKRQMLNSNESKHLLIDKNKLSFKTVNVQFRIKSLIRLLHQKFKCFRWNFVKSNRYSDKAFYDFQLNFHNHKIPVSIVNSITINFNQYMRFVIAMFSIITLAFYDSRAHFKRHDESLIFELCLFHKTFNGLWSINIGRYYNYSFMMT